MGKICSFFGHRTIYDKRELVENQLKEIINNLIEKENVDTFYVGDHGDFEVLSSYIACKAQKEHPNINVILVLSYANELQTARADFTDFILPAEVEATPKRACIRKRNKWTVDCSDYIVFYVKYYGCSRDTLDYAKKKEKKIIEITISNPDQVGESNT